MSWNRLTPALLTVLMLAAGCAGGSSTSPLGSAVQPPLPDSATGSSHLATASAPTASVKRLDSAVGGGTTTSPTPLWQFVEPLDVNDTAEFSIPPNVTQCSPLDPLLGQWYIALDSFSTPLSNVNLPFCTITTPAPTKFAWTAKHADSVLQPPSPGPDGQLYIVQLNVSLFSISLTPIAGPVLTNGTTWYFQPLESNLSFQKDHLYSFFVASYGGDGTPGVISI